MEGLFPGEAVLCACVNTCMCVFIYICSFVCVFVCVCDEGRRGLHQRESNIWLTDWLQLHTWAPQGLTTCKHTHTHTHTHTHVLSQVSPCWLVWLGTVVALKYQSNEMPPWAHFHKPQWIVCVYVHVFLCVSVCSGCVCVPLPVFLESYLPHNFFVLQ